jgi:hypothetical protein
MTFELLWKDYVRAQKQTIELMGRLAAFIADNRNAKLSLKAAQAVASFNPTTVKGRVLDIINEMERPHIKSSELLTVLNEQPGFERTNANAVRQATYDLVKGGYIIRLKHGRFKPVGEEDVEEVKF